MLRRTCVLAALILIACGAPSVPPDGGSGGGAGGGAAGGTADVLQPTLVSTMPATGSTSVAVDTVITVEFSEPMALASVSLSATPAVTFGAPTEDGTRLTFVATAPLAFSTSYTLTVSGTDLAGNALAGLTSFTFSTRGPPDTSPPSISSFTPTGAGVAFDTGLVVTFSEPMDPGSVAVVLSPPVAVGPPVFDPGEAQASFTLLALLDPSTTYTAQVSGADAAGNALTGTTSFTFTTRALPDTIAPTVVMISPADGATGVPGNTLITLTFSERMEPTATAAAFSMRKQGGGSVTGTLDWGVSALQLTFDPAVELDPSAVYLVALGTGARDTTGNQLAAAFSASFTTGVAPDTTPPTITHVTPPDGGVGLSRCDWQFSITFSEAMDVRATQTALSVRQMTPSPTRTIALGYEWTRDGTRLTVSRRTATPPAGECFDYGASVRLDIAVGADDLAGNHLAQPFMSTATVIRQTTTTLTVLPSISHTIFDNGATNTTVFVVGEASSTGGTARSLMTFSLTSLPEAAKITQATLKLRFAAATGNPFGALGALYVDSVDYGLTHDDTDYDAPVLVSCATFPPPMLCLGVPFHVQFAATSWTGERTLDVTRAVYADAARSSGTRSQFRAKFNADTATNGVQDAIRIAGGTAEVPLLPKLTVTYESP